MTAPADAKKAHRQRPAGLRDKDGALQKSWQQKSTRALSTALAVGAFALTLLITFSPARAETAVTLPSIIPETLTELRQQPALGATLNIRPGEQPLTEALVANYAKRQLELRSVSVTLAGPQAELTDDLLMGYISRGSVGEPHTALSAIASFTAPTPVSKNTVSSDLLASYLENGYQPTEKRLATANAERECLAQAIYHEARGESASGQLAVANVIVNRARSGKFPKSLCGVIYQNANKGLYRCQFTFACDGRDDTPTERGAWASSQDLAQRIYKKFAVGNEIGAVPGKALYYHTTAVRPSWANTFNQVAAVDSHIFYAPN
jgi:hypothetical protein